MDKLYTEFLGLLESQPWSGMSGPREDQGAAGRVVSRAFPLSGALTAFGPAGELPERSVTASASQTRRAISNELSFGILPSTGIFGYITSRSASLQNTHRHGVASFPVSVKTSDACPSPLAIAVAI